MSDEKRPEVLHRQKFMGGAASPPELHRALAWGGRRCDACGGASVVRILVFAEYRECLRRSPEFMLKLASEHDGQVPVVDFKQGKYVRVSCAYACANCRAEAERQAAKAPSWCCVEIDAGPKDIPVQALVPEKLNGG